MKLVRTHPLSLLTGFGLAALTFVALGQNAAPSKAAADYRIVDDVDDDELKKLAAEGWAYAGYLGQGMKGTGNDETLWMRAR